MTHEPVATQPYVAVGVIDGSKTIRLRLNGRFTVDGLGPLSGASTAHAEEGMVVLTDERQQELVRAPAIKLVAEKDTTFTLFGVTIGKRFHWEREEDQTFQGNLILKLREQQTIVAVNEIPLEDYLKSVISSEMSATAPLEFLKSHAIMSRSWLLAALEKRKSSSEPYMSTECFDEVKGEVARWYDREGHEFFDVCADDHCQRYQGITKITSAEAESAVRQTYGLVMTYKGMVCDARYSKACGGLTENFATAWDDRSVAYLVSVPDAPVAHDPISTEEEATRWILSSPEAYCHAEDQDLLKKILPDFDRETTHFFRWRIEYPREELEDIIRKKSGFDVGILREILPLHRGPSGRISRLKITGSKRSIIVGKELEIRRWLSPTHLYSSAFIVKTRRDSQGEIAAFTFVGAGWGHGVGLCQIGAAVMASRSFSAEEILKHYFPGVELRKIY